MTRLSKDYVPRPQWLPKERLQRSSVMCLTTSASAAMGGDARFEKPC